MVNKVTNTTCTCIYWGDEDMELRSETTCTGGGGTGADQLKHLQKDRMKADRHPSE